MGFRVQSEQGRLPVTWFEGETACFGGSKRGRNPCFQSDAEPVKTYGPGAGGVAPSGTAVPSILVRTGVGAAPERLSLA